MLDIKSALSNDSAFPGIAVLQPSSGKHLYQPTKNSETIIRVYPEVDEDGFMSFRASDEKDDFTAWLAVDYVARFVGSEQRITFITRCKDQNPSTTEMLWDRLVRTIFRGIDDQSHPEWVYLIRSKGGTGAPIPGQTVRQAKAKIHGFVQGLLLKHKGNNFRRQPKPNVVIMLSPTARISLQALCNEENPSWTGDPDDFNGRFKCGEWLGPTTGKELIIEFRKDDNEEDDSSVEIDYGNIGSGGLGTTPAGNNRTAFAKAYDVRLAAHVTPIPPDLIRQHYKPWDNVLRYLNEQEQVELMCSAFKPDVVKAAFGGLGLLPGSIEFGRQVSVGTTVKPAVTSGAHREEPVERVQRAEVSTSVSSPELEISFDNLDTSAPPMEVSVESGVMPESAEQAQDKMRNSLMEARKRIRK